MPMKAALLADRGAIKVVGDGARTFLHGLVTTDLLNLKQGEARYCALLTPQGKIIADFLAAEAPAKNGGGFFLDAPRTRIATLVERLNLYKLRAKVIVEDLSEILSVLAAWDGAAGWFFWNYKLLVNGSDLDGWDLGKSVELGYLPGSLGQK